ncbi:MAG: Lanthionine biosynthesis cyclase LanC [Bryobacterales bacterium]|nr:Lanthionine biosynthesis cyclase LanC [Bryobacterales bacterium]
MSNWIPILCGDCANGEQAYSVINAVTNEIRNGRVGDARIPHRRYEDSILFSYVGLGSPQEESLVDLAVERMNEQIAALSGRIGLNLNPASLGLFGGVGGLAWTVEHLFRLLTTDLNSPYHALPEEEDPLADIDKAIILCLRSIPRWHHQYDLISGLVGLGIYFLERIPSPVSRDGLEAVVDHLEELSVVEPKGLTWISGSALLPERQRTMCPNGYYNLGVAHGIPGIVHLLSEIVAAGVDRARCENMLARSLDWLLAQQEPGRLGSRFDSWIPVGYPRKAGGSRRLAWCYGDLGVLAVIVQVGVRTGCRVIQKAGGELLDFCLSCPPEAAGIDDAPLCHGSSGVAHIFNRLYQSTGDDRCLDMSLEWIDRTLAIRQSGEGVGGYKARTTPDPKQPPTWETTAALLDGSMGIALALQAATTAVDPGWDRLLCLSGRNFADKDSRR